MGAEGSTLPPVRDLPGPPPNFTGGGTVAGATSLCTYVPGMFTLTLIVLQYCTTYG